MIGKGAVVVDLDALYEVVSQYSTISSSEILTDFFEFIYEKKKIRSEIEKQINSGHYQNALLDRYGQFYFMDKIFGSRSKGKPIGTKYITNENNQKVYIDEIYSGTNNGGSPWTQYCFWGEKYPKNIKNENENEYHYLFWRIDCKWKKCSSEESCEWKPSIYIALRHYDGNAHSKNELLNERKKCVYRKFRHLADAEYEKKRDLFDKIGIRENYKESDLLYIPIEKIEHMEINNIKEILLELTSSFNQVFDDLYREMDKLI